MHKLLITLLLSLLLTGCPQEVEVQQDIFLFGFYTEDGNPLSLCDNGTIRGLYAMEEEDDTYHGTYDLVYPNTDCTGTPDATLYSEGWFSYEIISTDYPAQVSITLETGVAQTGVNGIITLNSGVVNETATGIEQDGITYTQLILPEETTITIIE